MSQITAIKITYGRTVQPAQYESKKAEAEFTATVDDGEDVAAIVDHCIHLAQSKVHEMVGLSKPTATKQPAKQAAKAEAPKAAPPTELDEKIQKPKGKSKADLEAEQALKLSQAAAVPAKGADIALDVLDAPATAPADPDGLDTVITPADIKEAVHKKMQHQPAHPERGAAIKAIREKFVKPPLGLADIPTEHRPAFLAQLALVP